MHLSDFINLNTFLLIGTMFIGVSYLYVFFRRGASQASIESNDILRGLIEDQKQENLSLRKRMHDVENRQTSIQLEVDHLKTQCDYLEKLIHGALLEFFAREPAVVKTVKASLATTSDRIEEEESKHGANT